MSANNYRLICQNPKCNHEFVRRFSNEEFDRIQYSTGHSCFDCGFKKMKVMKTFMNIRDTFQPGMQKNIRKWCDTYSQYKSYLKEMGLVEIGNEEMKMESHKQQYFDKDTVKHIVQNTEMKLSGNEIEALENGKMKDEGIY